MLKTILLILMLISWIVFIWSVLLMNPKGWLWFWVWGLSGVNEYWSKKSIENTLKKAAIVSIIIFLVSVLFYPYV